MIGNYVHGSGPHGKFWTKSLTTFDFLSKPKTRAYFTLKPYFIGLLLIFLTFEMCLTFAPARFFCENLCNFIGANARCILNVKKLNNNRLKYGHDVKNALIFGFETKSKVVNDFVQNFPC